MPTRLEHLRKIVVGRGDTTSGEEMNGAGIAGYLGYSFRVRTFKYAGKYREIYGRVL